MSGVGLVLAAFLTVCLAGAALGNLLPNWAQSIFDVPIFGAATGAAAMVYRSRVRAGSLAEPYPPLERRAVARPVAHRPDGEALVSVMATQAAGSGGTARGGRLRVYPGQVRFDPHRAGPASDRSWVARREEIARVTATPRRGGVTFPWSAPLLTVSLANGSVADFSLRHSETLAGRLGDWLTSSP